MKRDPFFGLRFKAEEVNVDFLSIDELDRIRHKQIDVPRLEKVRDIFVFCCFTGLAFADVSQLTSENIIQDGQGKLWIRKSRQKTKEMCNIRKHSDKCTFYTLRFDCSFAAANTIKPQLL